MDTTRHPFRTRSLALVLALTAPLGLLACSDDEPDRATVQSEGEADGGGGITSGSGADEEAPADAEEEPTDESTGGTASSGSREEVIGTSAGSHPAEPNDATLVPLRLDVNGARRTAGDIVEVLFTITNEGDVAYEPWRTLSDPEADDYDVGGAALVDGPGDTRYLALYDSEGTCLCTGNTDSIAIEPGQSGGFSVQITAPPEDVTEATFTLPGFDPIDGLVIS